MICLLLNYEGIEPATVIPVSSGNLAEGIHRLCFEGVSIDDDNEPTIENIPVANINTDQSATNLYQYWDSRTTCKRKSDGHCQENPKLLNSPSSETRLGHFS